MNLSLTYFLIIVLRGFPDFLLLVFQIVVEAGILPLFQAIPKF